MHKTIRILTLVAAMIIGAGEIWAEDGVKYIDKSGVEQTANNVTVLTGSTELATLGADGTEKWYVVKNSNTDGADAVFSGGIELAGVVHLILADGAEMTVDQDATVAQDATTAIHGGHALTIYGQSGGTGSLKASAHLIIANVTGGNLSEAADLTICGGCVSSTHGIIADNVTISGGEVNLDFIINASSNISISGGKVSVTDITSQNSDISISGGEVSAKNITSEKNNISISGGKVSASNNISAQYGRITLGLTEVTDYIYCYYYIIPNEYVSLSEDLLVINNDGTVNVISGGSTIDNINDINGKTLRAANYCGEFNADENYRYKGLVWYLAEGNDGVTTLHIEKNPNTPTGGMADYTNGNPDPNVGFAPWIKPNDAGNGSDGLRYGITAVAIGAGVTSIGKKAFYCCWDIFSNTGLTSVTFAEGSQLKSIGEQAFLGCEGLTTMTLPSSLTTIGNSAFGLCGFTDVTIPASVTSIGSGAFSCCYNLETVIFERYDTNDSEYPITAIGLGSFSESNIKAILVPSEAAYKAYKAAGTGSSTASGWVEGVKGRPLKSLLAPATISVAKNVSEYEWSTFCHNYPVSYSPSDGNTGDNTPRVYAVSRLSADADGKSVVIKEVEDNLVSPGTPLLLNYSGTGYLTLTAEPTTAQTLTSTDALVSTSGDGWAFIGNAGSDLASDADALKDIIHIVHNDNDKSGIASYVLSGSDFVIVNENSGLKAHRCLLNVSSGTASSARRLSIARGGETTGTSTPEPTYGNINYYDNVYYHQPNAYGGWLNFYKDADCQNPLPSIAPVSGLTDGIVYIKAEPDNLHTLKGFLPEVEKCSESGSAQSRNRSLRVDVGVPIEVTAVDGKTGVYQFTMPADGSNVVVSMAFPDKDYETKVKYLSWNNTDKKLEETTTDDNTKVYILDGTETELEGGWYIAKSDIDLSKYGGIELKGDVHLILADKAAMTCSGIKDAWAGSLDLTIHGQSTGDDMGKLTATSASLDAIFVRELTINGGIVEASNSDDDGGIFANILTIHGGRVKATNIANNDYGITAGNFYIYGGHVEASGNYGIHAETMLEINGGQVEATGTTSGIYYVGDCTLGWTDPDNDYIKVSGIKKVNGATDVSAAKRFVAYNDAEGNAASGIIDAGNISDFSTIAGKTLRPLDGYVVKDLAGLTFSGKTDADGKPKPDFTITDGTPAVTYPYYIYKKDATVTVTSTGHEDDYAEFIADDYSTGASLSLSETEAKSHAFTMPAQDVIFKHVKYYNVAVPYLDPLNGGLTTTGEGEKVYVLESSDEKLQLFEEWYIAKGEINYSHTIKGLSINLILADGAKMTVATADNEGMCDNTGELYIYGQSTGEDMGQLIVTCTNQTATSWEGISFNKVYINGGKVTVTSPNYGIWAYLDNNTPGGTAITDGDIYYNGGQVISSGIVRASTTQLQWTNSSDFFEASLYEGKVSIPGGFYFYDGSKIYGGTSEYKFVPDDEYDGTGDKLSSIAGKRLFPALNAQKPDTEGDTYVGFGSDRGNFKLNDPNAQVYVITGYDLEEGVVYLTPVTGNEIPDGVAVIIGNKTDGSPLNDDLWLVGELNLSPDAETDGNKSVANFVFGDSYKTLQELIDGITGSTDTPVSDYVVFILKDGKFKPIIANASGKPGQGECLLIIPKVELLKQVIVGGGSSARKLIIDLGNATGIEENAQCTMHNAQSDGEWYDLQGRKLDGQPATKGVFIHNGNKIVITK